MFFAQRDENGDIIGDTRGPTQGNDIDPIDEESAEWIEYLNRVPEERRFSLGDLTDDENNKLIDFFVTNDIITTEKAKKFKTKP